MTDVGVSCRGTKIKGVLSYPPRSLSVFLAVKLASAGLPARFPLHVVLCPLQATLGPEREVYAPKCLCLLSTWPHFGPFREWLLKLYRISLSPFQIPLERYIGNFLVEVPTPSPGRVEVRRGQPSRPSAPSMSICAVRNVSRRRYVDRSML